ncbi:energy transducer TonB [uncultured Marixanthomonas sp.]|uniref:energy transducer TonB n=1 Tax=uncultured Marixanthomonas sp. TaxID=757245 RepID=UPI0030D9AE0F|tara:strand:+ start:1607 stop:2026 length:420 start_codon:yes stop_codon:yes gene_type:complete
MIKKLLFVFTVLISAAVIAQHDFKQVSDSLQSLNSEKIDKAVTQLGLKPGETVKIFAMFSVDTDGSIIDVKARSIHPAFEEEAIRVIQELPAMEPALVEGETIKQKYSLPILFKIETEQERKKRKKREYRKMKRKQRKS